LEVISLETLVLIVAAFLILIAPGLAIYVLAERVLAPRTSNAVPLAPLFGIGLSIGFWPLLLLYCSLIGIHFVPLFVGATVAISLVVALIAWWPQLKGYRPSSDGIVSGLALASLTIFALVFRLGDIQGLAVPMFGDSLHHTMITTIIAQTGQVPTSYQPFVPVTTFTYHFGFHTLAAVLSKLTGATVPDAVLIMGQVLIVLSIPVAYLFGRVLFRSSLAGLVSALITGFISVMPSYYVNWGRYTQLAGQILLPVALALLVRLVRGDSRRLDFALTAFCIGALGVVHYRILIFYGLFALALAIWRLVTCWGRWSFLVGDLARVVGAGAIGVLVAAPWLANVLANYYPGLARRLGSVTTEYIAGYNSLDNFTRYVGVALALLGALGVFAAIVSLARQSFRAPPKDTTATGDPPGLPASVAALTVATWAGLMFASLWPIPGAIGSYTVAIALYIPLSALGGYGAAWATEVLQHGVRIADAWLSVAVAAGAPICAILFSTAHIAHPELFAYVRDPDLKAFDWINSNTPTDAGFLISSEISYAGRGLTASDAGMWIPLEAGRKVSVPALSAWTEQPIVPDFFTDTRKLAVLTQPLDKSETQQTPGGEESPTPAPPGSQATLALMQKLGINYIFSGSPGGASKQRLDIAGMRKDRCHFQLVYGPEGGVNIFRVLYDGSGCAK